MESRRRGDDHGKREGRRSKRGEDNTQASTIGDRLLHPLEPVRTSNLVDALFAKFLCHQREQKDPQRRAASGGKNVHRHFSMMLRNKSDDHQIISERQK